MMRRLSHILVALLLALGAYAQAPQFGVTYTGDGTYYSRAAAIGGNCDLNSNGPGDIYLAAINKAQYALSYACGGCAYVTGPYGSVTVRIQDQCPECPFGDLDFSDEAFSVITGGRMGLGRVDISWYLVPCTSTGNLKFKIKDGSNQWWTAVEIVNSKLPIRLVEVKIGTSWVSLPRTDYNYWLRTNGFGPGPFFFRVTAIDGQQLEQGPFTLSPSVLQTGTAQFSAPGGGGGGNPTPVPFRTSTPALPTRTPPRTPLRTSSPPFRSASARLPTLRSTASVTLRPTQRPGTGGCTVRYSTPSVWNTGYTASVTFTTTSALTQWTLVFSLPTGQSISSLWDGALSSSGQTITVRNLSYNGNVGANGGKTFGFNGNKPTNVNPGSPSAFTLNGVVCSIA
mmetsp:Transcript_43580/g.70757  ORF Transcript_43580/g.70757 Transcript_43580/m.70757 type:complete len:397 (-) Transcript_43580:301-1491(-)|eukprot:CAMPEP_0184333824 /NCGR_PEP_ID=MMETSP1089-20130417/2773_1 /TAXON_ID=38269 ORGANISM="Gloeochaete wittrockiana, Strain SAG46.84" /NCGR_SAMPLE_ID=MMETSP1089 /ASSEMBLY_ACC=CAM_ASM_000445 /LENGTH=396 /DNA_ID=CAMNT_0026657863 /DNA_START=264 /DNA_END=1454 /DNA_ORIENTATION=-